MASGLLAFDLLFSVPDLPRFVFGALDLTSLSLAANVCKKWREVCRMLTPAKDRFRLDARDIIQRVELMGWALGVAKIAPDGSASRLCELAASQGALKSLQWLRGRGYSWTFKTSISAAKNGHLETLRWAVTNGCSGDSSHLFDEAAIGGHLNVLKWLYGAIDRPSKTKMLNRVCWFAASRAHVEVLTWVADVQGVEFTRSGARAECCYGAADGGRLAVLKWAVGDIWPSGSSSIRLRCMALASMNLQHHIIEWIDGPKSPRLEEVE